MQIIQKQFSKRSKNRSSVEREVCSKKLVAVGVAEAEISEKRNNFRQTK